MCQRVVSGGDSPLLYDPICCIQSSIHLGSNIQCDLTLDIGYIGLPHGILHLL